MTELKPCPFCGAPAELEGVYMFGSTVWFVNCLNPECEIRPGTGHYDTKDEAVKVWNRRAVEDLREELRQMTERYHRAAEALHVMREDEEEFQ